MIVKFPSTYVPAPRGTSRERAEIVARLALMTKQELMDTASELLRAYMKKEVAAILKEANDARPKEARE